ncbi:MAG: hypothetical protein ACYC64_13295 [Armatimonadota bacterium]
MNALPVGPLQVADADQRQRYFDDFERWGFEIAYNAFQAVPYDDVVGALKDAYTGFVTEAHKRGYPACIQIQSTICAGDKVGLEEAQYDINNIPQKWGENGFYASFASEAWKDYLKRLITLFVRQYGFDYVVFEEAPSKVDISGSKDQFHAKYVADNPGVRYPDMREETTEYLLVQQAKAVVIEDFYKDLVAHAKSVGAKKAGVMPCSFIPTVENTPECAPNTSCNISRIARIPDLDFLVVKMQPDNILAENMRTDGEMTKSPMLSYIEVLAHALGKDVIAVSNPTNEQADGCPLIPLEFFTDATISSLAAAPCGFTRHWYGQNYGKDDAYMEVLCQAADAARRLGRPKSPVAFVFSYSGLRHADPLTCETVFSHYWALAKQMAFEAHIPMLTFHAETLDRDLMEHPEVQLLVFEEHFPLTMEQMLVIRNWWQSTERRAAIAFGSGAGYSADPNLPGLQPCAGSFPGILELIGIRQEEGMTITFDEPVVPNDVSRVRRSAFLSEGEPTKLHRVADARRIFGSRANILYELEVDDAKVPVVAEWRDRSTLAVFCGFGLSSETASMAEKAIYYALREVNAPTLMIDSCSDGVLWNINASDYVILSNVSGNEGHATGRPGRANFWDVREQRMLPDGIPDIRIAPHSFQLYRVVGRRSKFFDVQGALCLRRLTDGAGRAEIELLAGRKTVLVLRNSPKEIQVDGKACTISQEVVGGVYYVTLLQCHPGERIISLKW